MALKKNVPPKRRPAPKSQAKETSIVIADPPKPQVKKAAPRRAATPVSKPITEPPKATTPPQPPPPKPQPTPPKPQPTPTNQPTQLTYNQLREKTLPELIKLWEALNKVKSDDFIQIVRRDQLPKTIVLRMLEAKERNVITFKPPGKNNYYCPYCTDYMHFKHHAYTGYDKCIGCGISTRDFYVSADNHLF